jgi:hypothetical protein
LEISRVAFCGAFFISAGQLEIPQAVRVFS